jgi:cGMP-dependent 3',5'-cyclic phosphodiesterase
MSMFYDLGFVKQYRISQNTLARFVLMVKRGYRDPPYHNWTHAFTVQHFAYLCLKNLPLEEHLKPMETLSYFVAALCHDIDHRGTNNSFQMASNSVLAALYSSEGSVLERHHLSQTMFILNTDGCNIFENLTSEEYCEVLDHIRDIILATDLAHHLRIIKDIEVMTERGYSPDNSKEHYLLLCLLMTCADLSDQSKNWKNLRSVAAMIYQEFFSQGDMEKALGRKPAEQMDRERACVPDQQVSFLDAIAAPCFRLLAKLYPATAVIMRNIEANRARWTKMSVMLKEGRLGSSHADVFSTELIELEPL